VTRTVWCATRRQNVPVDFVEWMDTGMVHRSVRQCALRSPSDQCDGACSYPSA
jgi:hypothetical protein